MKYDERNHSDCKYVEFFIYHVGTIGAPNIRIVLLEGQTPNVEKSLTLRVGTGKRTFYKRDVQDLRPRQT
jgi:hypothetical protein